MFYIFLVTLLIASMCDAFDRPPKFLKDQRIIEKINNNPHSTWKATNYYFDEIDVNQFTKTKLGLKFRNTSKSIKNMKNIKSKTPAAQFFIKCGKDLPKFFTWTDKNNTNCSIDYIKDQSGCGSCWAVASVSALEDRFCIQSKGKIKAKLSSGYVMSCDTQNYGCYGGYLDYAHNFFVNNGVITGGDFESDEGCQPYPIQPCTYSNGRPNRMPCLNPFTPKCRNKKCTNDWDKYRYEPDEYTYKARKYKFVNGGFFETDECAIQKEIYKNGPVTSGFLVLNDFVYYKEGIYNPVGWNILGAHAVRIVGWGVENNVKYWIVANSWGRDWGENGWFRIIRGVNAVWIEDFAISAEPLLNKIENV